MVMTSTSILNKAYAIYPVELCLGVVIAWYLGEDRLQLHREKYYFVRSKNFVNEIFAYKGNLVWTILFVSLAYVQINARCRNQATLPRDQRTLPSSPLRGLLKQYASKIILKMVLLAIIFWFIDSVFIITGGSCLLGEGTQSAERCRAGGGKWVGGFDISGHFCFLVNVSMILWFELSHYQKYLERESVLSPNGMLAKSIIGLVVCVLVVWILMLMITAIYYHTILEKILGCSMGYICVLVMYRLVPHYPSVNDRLYS